METGAGQACRARAARRLVWPAWKDGGCDGPGQRRLCGRGAGGECGGRPEKGLSDVPTWPRGRRGRRGPALGERGSGGRLLLLFPRVNSESPLSETSGFFPGVTGVETGGLMPVTGAHRRAVSPARPLSREGVIPVFFIPGPVRTGRWRGRATPMQKLRRRRVGPPRPLSLSPECGMTHGGPASLAVSPRAEGVRSGPQLARHLHVAGARAPALWCRVRDSGTLVTAALSSVS